MNWGGSFQHAQQGINFSNTGGRWLQHAVRCCLLSPLHTLCRLVCTLNLLCITYTVSVPDILCLPACLLPAWPVLPVADGKTKSLVSAVSKVSGGAKKVLLVLSQYDAMVDRAGRNVENLTINVASSLQVRWGTCASCCCW